MRPREPIAWRRRKAVLADSNTSRTFFSLVAAERNESFRLRVETPTAPVLPAIPAQGRSASADASPSFPPALDSTAVPMTTGRPE